ncbi:MAG: NUDIX domain-containing protein [Bacteroidales bacterium]|nr:NUDIX domain-containing protein [Bacteroidales bacterium]MCF8326833.1 NUDIX domain-containing protein [Bacteroidales bacterium]
MNDSNHFNIRIYGLLFNEYQQLLLTDEYRLNMYMTKFPGGGLEPGEGTIDCLKRECSEELGQQPVDIHHFYTTDFYQPTKYLGKNQQLISIYYTGKLIKPYQFEISQKPFDFKEIDGMQTFRWKKPTEIQPSELTMPIDKIVIEKLKNYY